MMEGRNFFEKFNRISIKRRMESPSPSQSLLLAECQYGVAKHACAFENPITLPIMPTEVCGASPTIRCPRRSCGFSTL